MASQPLMFPEMRLQQVGTLVFMQPMRGSAVAGPSLTVELGTGTVGLAEHSVPLKGPDTIYGVIGLARFLGGCALTVITDAEQVAIVRGYPVWKVTGTRVLTNGNKSIRDDNRYLKLLKLGLDPSRAGQGLYYSYHTNLTLSQQRIAEQGADTPAKPAWKQANPNFFWNRFLAAPFTESETEQVGRFVVPLIMGSLQQLPDLQLGGSRKMTVTLIARRSVQRPGVRHWRRGADPQGAVANQVETEQLVTVSGGDGSTVTSSFVQLRGSIPLMWSQIPNIKYKPATQVAPLEASEQAFDAHIKDLLRAYEAVVAVNLANQHGSEGLLGKAFIRENTRFAGSTSGLRLVSFDFHKVCGSRHYERLDLLWQEIADDFGTFGCWFQDSSKGEPERQRGILRINCIDCLDRTNVVQGFIARHHLEAVLRRLSALPPGGSLPRDLPAVEAKFKMMWANHGDDISNQYAGTGALKSGFTRTGKRTYGGLVDDGVKSLTRYYLNNFSDGRKQDALDLVTGTFRVDKTKPSPFKVQASPLVLILIALLAILFAVRSFFVLALGGLRGDGQASSLPVSLLQQVLLPLVLAFIIFKAISANGKRLVNRPQLCPRLAHPWAVDAAVDPGGAHKH